MKADIAAEIYAALQRLGAGGQLLSIVGSYGDTLDDDDVLQLLRDWNRRMRANSNKQASRAH